MEIKQVMQNITALEKADAKDKVYSLKAVATEDGGVSIEKRKGFDRFTSYLGHGIRKLFRSSDNEKYAQLFEKIIDLGGNQSFTANLLPFYSIINLAEALKKYQKIKKTEEENLVEKHNQEPIDQEFDSTTDKSEDEPILFLKEVSDENYIDKETLPLANSYQFLVVSAAARVTEIRDLIGQSTKSDLLPDSIKYIIDDIDRPPQLSIKKLMSLSKQLHASAINPDDIESEDKQLMLKCLDYQLNIDKLTNEEKLTLNQIFTPKELSLIADVAKEFKEINVSVANRAQEKYKDWVKHNPIEQQMADANAKGISLEEYQLNKGFEFAESTLITFTHVVTAEKQICSPLLTDYYSFLFAGICNPKIKLTAEAEVPADAPCLIEAPETLAQQLRHLGHLMSNPIVKDHATRTNDDIVYVSPFIFKKLHELEDEKINEFKTAISNLANLKENNASDKDLKQASDDLKSIYNDLKLFPFNQTELKDKVIFPTIKESCEKLNDEANFDFVTSTLQVLDIKIDIENEKLKTFVNYIKNYYEKNQTLNDSYRDISNLKNELKKQPNNQEITSKLKKLEAEQKQHLFNLLESIENLKTTYNELSKELIPDLQAMKLLLPNLNIENIDSLEAKKILPKFYENPQPDRQALLNQKNKFLFISNTTEDIQTNNKNPNSYDPITQFEIDVPRGLVHINGVQYDDVEKAKGAIRNQLNLDPEIKETVVQEIFEYANQSAVNVISGMTMQQLNTMQFESAQLPNDPKTVPSKINIIIDNDKVAITGYTSTNLIDPNTTDLVAQIDSTIVITKDLTTREASKPGKVDAYVIINAPTFPRAPLESHLAPIPPFVRGTDAFKEVKVVETPALLAIEPMKNLKGQQAIHSFTFTEPEKNVDGKPIAEINQELSSPKFENLKISLKDLTPSPNMGASAINTYPSHVDHPKFDINCDAFHMFELEGGAHVTIVADGAQVHKESKNAAQNAIVGAVKSLQDSFKNKKLDNGVDIANALIDALKAAQKETLNNNYTGQTTFNMTLSFEDKNGDTVFFKISVGDSTAYLLTPNESGEFHQLINLNANSRDGDPVRLSNPGGVLGHSNEGSSGKPDQPDLGNLTLETFILPKGTPHILLNMSDGVTDNLNPIALGLSVQDVCDALGKDIIKENWKELDPRNPKTPENLKNVAADLIREFQDKKLKEIIAEIKPEDFTVQKLCEKITSYCADSTKEKREHYFDADGETWYPGKVDHVTIIGYKVGAK